MPRTKSAPKPANAAGRPATGAKSVRKSRPAKSAVTSGKPKAKRKAKQVQLEKIVVDPSRRNPDGVPLLDTKAFIRATRIHQAPSCSKRAAIIAAALVTQFSRSIVVTAARAARISGRKTISQDDIRQSFNGLLRA